MSHAITNEEKAMQELRELLTKRIAEGLAGVVSPKSFDKIVEDELNLGGSA